MIPLSPRHRRNARTAGKRFRPQVCALEDRCLLSTLVTDFLLPAPATAIVRGPDGNVWFTEPAAQKIAQITPAGTITQFDLPAGSHASGLAVGTDGNLWITDNALKQIDRITPAGIVTQFPVATTTSGSSATATAGAPLDIVAGPDGHLWVTLTGEAHLGRVSTAGVFTDFNLGNIQPDDLTAGADGNLWFIDRQRGLVGRVTLTGQAVEFELPGSGDAAAPASLAAGPDGNMWFSEGFTGHAIVKVTPSGQMTSYSLPTGVSAFDMHAGPDGALWFAGPNTLGRLDPHNGIIAAFPSPIANPEPFTFGSDGNIWFANGGRISRLDASTLPVGHVTGMLLVEVVGSVSVTITFSGSTSTAQNNTAQVSIASDSMTVARFAIPNSAGLAAQSFPSAFPSYLVLAPQSYAGVLSIQVALAQALSANPVQVHTGAAGGNPTGTGGASGSTGYVPWQSITDHGTVSWQSITDHGTASSQGTSTTAVTVLHVTQTQESLTSLPANVSVGGLVAITLQISSGGGQEAPPARLDARADMRAEVSSSATRANSYGSAGQAGGAAPQTSEPAQATSNIAAAVLEVVNIRDEESTGRALGGESLLTAAPSQHELLAIVQDILASDPLLLREKAVPTDWVARTLVGAAVGMLFAQPLVWGMAIRRRRETEQLLPISR